MSQTDPPAEPVLDSEILQVCSVCEAVMDVSDEEPLTRIACPACGGDQWVTGAVAHFELQETVGRGGMGVVYRAIDAQLGRAVAIKLLRRDASANRDLVQKLETEASITASINHPHVVRVFTTGSDHGRFFIAMELVDKGTLDDLIKLQGRVAEPQVLEVGVQIAQGLRAALQAGLIHRDVKPGNILFADAHTSKIVDFGLAIFMEDEEQQRGEVWGTPYYVAPEKLDRQPEDFRSDMYSLGGTLFHALAGRPPFEAEDASMVALKHLKSQAVSLQAFAPHVSGETAYVINKTLSKDPNDRYQSYDELIEHLEYALDQIKQKGSQPAQQKRLILEDEQQQKAMGWFTAAMIVLILIGGVFAFLFRDRIFGTENRPETLAVVATPAAVPVFQDARKLLTSGDAEDAASLYKSQAANPKLSVTDRAWAHYCEGLAHLLAGKLPAANAAFKTLVDSSPSSGTAEEQKLIAFLTSTAGQLTDKQPIAPSSAASFSGENYEALGALAFALKDWHIGKIKESVSLFQQFRQSRPKGADAWIGELKPLATNFMEEYAAFEMAGSQLKAAKNAKQRDAALKNLRQAKGPLKAKAAQLEKSIAAPASGDAPK